MTPSPPNPFAAFREFAKAPPPSEHCDLCNIPLAPEHQHVVDPENRRLFCACDACAMTFMEDGTTRLRRVPRDAWALPGFTLGEDQWGGLNIPIGLAFFFLSSASGKVVAVYPSPAGPTESEPSDEAWARLVKANPQLREMLPDVEALLVNKVRGAQDHYLVPIDQCYKLVGLIRAHWEGFTGGDKAWDTIHRFFENLTQRARTKKRAKARPQAAEEAAR